MCQLYYTFYHFLRVYFLFVKKKFVVKQPAVFHWPPHSSQVYRISWLPHFLCAWLNLMFCTVPCCTVLGVRNKLHHTAWVCSRLYTCVSALWCSHNHEITCQHISEDISVVKWCVRWICIYVQTYMLCYSACAYMHCSPPTNAESGTG